MAFVCPDLSDYSRPDACLGLAVLDLARQGVGQIVRRSKIDFGWIPGLPVPTTPHHHMYACCCGDPRESSRVPRQTWYGHFRDGTTTGGLERGKLIRDEALVVELTVDRVALPDGLRVDQEMLMHHRFAECSGRYRPKYCAHFRHIAASPGAPNRPDLRAGANDQSKSRSRPLPR